MQQERTKNQFSSSILNDSDFVFSITPVQKLQNPIDLSNTFDINFMDEAEDFKIQEQSRSKSNDQVKISGEDYLDGAVNRRALFTENENYFKEESDSVISSPKVYENQLRETADNIKNTQSQFNGQRKTSYQSTQFKDNNPSQKQNSNNERSILSREIQSANQDNRIIRIQQNDQSYLANLDQVLLQNSIRDQESENFNNKNTKNNNGQTLSDYYYTQQTEFENNNDQQEGALVPKNFKQSKFNPSSAAQNNQEENMQNSIQLKFLENYQTNLHDTNSIVINSQYFQAECINIASINQSQQRKLTQNHDKMVSEDGFKSPFAINASQQSCSQEKGKTEDYTQEQRLKQYRETTPTQKQGFENNAFKKLNLLRLTNKFIDIMKRNSRATLYKRLKPNHIRIINDKSVYQYTDRFNDIDEIQNFSFKQSFSSRNFFSSNQKSKKSSKDVYDSDGLLIRTENVFFKFFQFQLKSMQKQINKLPTLPPDNSLLLVWNMIMFFSLIILIFYIPIECAFRVLDSNFIQNLGVLLIIADTIMKFNTGFFKDGYVIQQRTKIFVEVFKFQLWFNLISILALLSSPYNGAQFLFLINVFTIFNLMDKFDNYFQFKQRFFIYSEVIKLGFIVGLLASTFGSIFYFISSKQVERGEKNAWILTKEINNWHDGYIFSLYFMFITMSTVGYGDLTPMNQAEVVFVGFTSMLCSCVFAYCINTIGNMLSDISQRESCFKQRKNDVLQYLNSRNISRNLQTKIIRYLEYLKNIENSQSHINAADIMKFFSDNLKFEVNKEFFGKQLRESKVFGLNFTHSFLNSLAQTMKEITLAPGDILYQKNQSDNRILFLTSGDIELFEKEVRLRLLQKGEVLNYRGFFGNFSHSSSARSLTISHLSYCTKEDLIEVLKTFPQDYEIFCYMRDEMMLYNRTIDSKCCSCQSYSHTFQECPLIHYRINKDIVLRRWNFSSQNERQEIHRNKSKFKSFINLQVVKNKLKQYKVDLISKIEEYSYLQGNDMIEYLGDKEFYKHLPSIKVSEDGKVYQQSEYSNTDNTDFSEEELNTEQIQNNPKGSLVNQNTISYSPKVIIRNRRNSSNSSQNLHQGSTKKQQEDDILTDPDKLYNHQPSIEFQIHASSMTFNKQISNIENGSNQPYNVNNNYIFTGNNQLNNILNPNSNLISNVIQNPSSNADSTYRNQTIDNLKPTKEDIVANYTNNATISLDFNQSQQLFSQDINITPKLSEQQNNSKQDPGAYKLDNNNNNTRSIDNIINKQDSLQHIQVQNVYNQMVIQKQNSSNSSNNQSNNQKSSGNPPQQIQQQYSQNSLFVQQPGVQQNKGNKKNFKLSFKQYNSSDSSDFQKQQSKRSKVQSMNNQVPKQSQAQMCQCNVNQIIQHNIPQQNNSILNSNHSHNKGRQASNKLSKMLQEQINQQQQLQQELLQINSAYLIPNQENNFNEGMLKSDQIFHFDFDQMKEFASYYPHNNFKLVIKQLQQYMRSLVRVNRINRRLQKKNPTFVIKRKKKPDTPLQKVIKLLKD